MSIRVLFLAVALGCFPVAAQLRSSVPTNSLPFHLHSLGRTPTSQEREIVESTLALMWRHGCRSDYPLRSIKHDDGKKEWVLVFASDVADGGLDLYLRDSTATWFEVQFAGTTWRTRFPATVRKK